MRKTKFFSGTGDDRRHSTINRALHVYQYLRLNGQVHGRQKISLDDLIMEKAK